MSYEFDLTLKDTSLSTEAAEYFRYTNQGEETQIPGTDDVVELERTRNAFTILGKQSISYCVRVELPLLCTMCTMSCFNVFFGPTGVQSDQQMELFRILAAVLHLGNINIQASGRGGDRSYIDVWLSLTDTRKIDLSMPLSSQ